MKTLWLIPAFALTMLGTDLTGKWTGKIEITDPVGDKISTPVKAEFDQKATAVSGKIGRSEDEQSEPIKNARLEDKKLSFEVQPPEATGPMKFTLVLVNEDRIEGEMKGAVDVGNISGKVVLQKVKK